jgi:hypothetical protein
MDGIFVVAEYAVAIPPFEMTKRMENEVPVLMAN